MLGDQRAALKKDVKPSAQAAQVPGSHWHGVGAAGKDREDRSHACSATWRGKAITDDLSGIGGVDGIAGHGQFSGRKAGRDAGDRPGLAVLESEADKRFQGDGGRHDDGVAAVDELMQNFEICFNSKRIKAAKLILEGRVIGLLRTNHEHYQHCLCKKGGTAETQPATAHESGNRP